MNSEKMINGFIAFAVVLMVVMAGFFLFGDCVTLQRFLSIAQMPTRCILNQ